MSDLVVMLVVAFLIPALLIIAVMCDDFIRGEHPHRRVSDH